METRRSRRRLADPVLPCAVVATADHSRTASEDCFGFLGVNRSFLNGFIARANLRIVLLSHVATSFRFVVRRDWKFAPSFHADLRL